MSTKGRTVLHGISQSCPTHADLPTTGNMGSQCYVEDTGTWYTYDLNDQTWYPNGFVTFEYDVRASGGAVGSYDTGVEIPANVIVWDGFLDVTETFTSGGAATVTIRAAAAEGAAGDIVNAAAVGALTAGLVAITPDGTVVNAIKTTTARSVRVDVATADLTGGVLRGYLRAFRASPVLDTSSSSSSLSSSSSSSSSNSSSSSSSASSQSSLSSQTTSSSSQSSQTTSSSSQSSQTTSSSSQSVSSQSASSSSSSSNSSSSSSSNSSSSSSGLAEVSSSSSSSSVVA